MFTYVVQTWSAVLRLLDNSYSSSSFLYKNNYYQINKQNNHNKFKVNYRTYSASVRWTKYEMAKAYLRNTKDSNELHISFRYTNESLKIDRNFNFCRRMNENIDDALVRIKSNIEKEFQKRNKKKTTATKASQAPGTLCKIDIDFLREDRKQILKNLKFFELLNDISTGLTLRICDKNFNVVLNPPWVQAVTLPSSILADFLVYPNKLELQFAERKHCKVVWYKAELPPSGDLHHNVLWKLCGEGLFYKTTNEDVNHHLKLIFTPANYHGNLGPPVEYISKSPVQAGPGLCSFDLRHLYTKQPLNDAQKFRIVTYNLLADYYSDSDYSRNVLFPYCPTNALAIDYRKQLFLKELMGYNADVICLQEVDLKVFELDLTIMLAASPHNMHGHIAQKGTCAEGIATFYRESRFQLINKYEVNLGENISKNEVFKSLWLKIKDNAPLITRICDRSTTLQITVLKCHNTDRYLLVANTHLYFHPDADHIRLLQIGFSLLYIDHVYRKTISSQQIDDERCLSIVFCGDFNSVPECGIYRLMTEGNIGNDFQDWQSNATEAVKNVTLKQPFKMSSACGTPKYTNYTTLFAACLDYIFYQHDRLEVLNSVPLPTDEELSANIALPSVCFPSDHIALIADLKFKT